MASRTDTRRAVDVAVRTRGDEIALAGGLDRLGLVRDDALALMLSNRPEFHVCDLAAMMVGATPFSIYQTWRSSWLKTGDIGAFDDEGYLRIVDRKKS